METIHVKNEKRIKVITSNGDIYVSFEKMDEMHIWREHYNLFVPLAELNQLGQLFYNWCSGLDIEHSELRTSEDK